MSCQHRQHTIWTVSLFSLYVGNKRSYRVFVVPRSNDYIFRKVEDGCVDIYFYDWLYFGLRPLNHTSALSTVKRCKYSQSTYFTSFFLFSNLPGSVKKILIFYFQFRLLPKTNLHFYIFYYTILPVWNLLFLFFYF